MALVYVLAGANHFISPDFYLPIMPPWLPAHQQLVFLSGVAEVVLGIAILVPKLQRPAAWGVIALLVAVFPANIHMAVHEIAPMGLTSPPVWVFWARLPLQGLLIGWAWWYTRED